MKPDSRKIIHLGINFLFAPRPNLEAKSRLLFQQALLDAGLDYSTMDNSAADKFVITRQTGSPLEIMVGSPNPQVGQLLIIASRPQCTLSLFIDEAEAVAQAFKSTWPTGRQILQSDLAIRELSEATREHAFQELWEARLHQTSDVLNIFERPILGGGLRFVMPPLPGEKPPVQIEVKIESFLHNTSMIFVELQCMFLEPYSIDDLLIRQHFTMASEYLEKSVYPFIKGVPNDPR